MQNLHNLHVLVDLNQENHVQTFAQLKQKYNKISKQPNDDAEYEQLTAKSSVFPPIWLSYHLFISQIERFSSDLAKESQVLYSSSTDRLVDRTSRPSHQSL